MTKRYVTLAEVRDLLQEAEEERELTMEQKFALNHADAFTRLSKDDSEALVKKLLEVEFVHEKLAYKIADIIPETEDEVKAIFAKERTVIGKSEIKEIMDIVGEYV